MMNRRIALVAIAAATGGAVSSKAALARLLESGQARQDAPSGALPKEAVDEVDVRLREDLARLAPRAYSEEGIPVFLACEDLVADRTSQKSAATLTPFNAALAADLRKNAEAWQRIHPHATDADVGKLIEVLADRDFVGGGGARWS